MELKGSSISVHLSSYPHDCLTVSVYPYFRMRWGLWRELEREKPVVHLLVRCFIRNQLLVIRLHIGGFHGQADAVIGYFEAVTALSIIFSYGLGS